MQDLISDFVARVNNGVMAEKANISVLKNKLVINICKKLTTLGYLVGFEDAGTTLKLELNLGKIRKLKRMSKPGQRVYVSYQMLPKVTNGIGWNLITTPKGVLTGLEAKKEKVGGELLFQITSK